MTAPPGKTPTVEEARALGKKYGMQGIVIIHHDGDHAGYASWGHTKAECTWMRGFADRCFRVLMRLWAETR